MDRQVPSNGPQADAQDSLAHASFGPHQSRRDAHAALSLLSDESLLVRREAAEFLSFHTPLFDSPPAGALQQLFYEKDPFVVSSLLSCVAEIPDRRGLVAPVCLRLMKDSHREIALEAAQILSEGRELGLGPVIPLEVFSRTHPRVRDERLELVSAAHEAPTDFQRTVRAAVDQQLSLSERAQKAQLKDLVMSLSGRFNDEALHAVLIGLCSPGSSVRALSLKVLSAYSSHLTAEQKPLVWGALAFAMSDYELASCVMQHEFFNAVRSSDMPAELAPMIEGFDCRDDVDVKMARDFTAVYLARHADPCAAVERLADMLWAPHESTVGAAASNLSILLVDIDRTVGVKIVDSLMEALIDRVLDGRAVTDAFIRAFSQLDGFHAEVLERCSNALSLHQSPEVMIAIARLVGSMPASDPQLLHEATQILEYLSRAPYARVARTANYILSR